MKEISSTDDLGQTLDASKQQPVFIFKHSTACPTSARAKERLADFISRRGPEGIPPFFMVKVIEARPISNKVAEDLGVRHQSPQLILVKDGKAVWSASHYGIAADAIIDALAEHANTAAG